MGNNIENQNHFSAAYSLETNAQTKDHYRTWAESYDQEVGEENGYAQPARTAEMLARFNGDKSCKILDAGCGSGLSGVALKMAGYEHIEGCDFSPEMLAKAAEKQCYNNLFQANLNEEIQSVSNGHFDAVVCVGVFSFGHVFPDACDELLRVLRPGGTLIIALNEQYWAKGDLENKLNGIVAAGKAQMLAKEFGDHLPGHNVNGWVLAFKKLKSAPLPSE